MEPAHPGTTDVPAAARQVHAALLARGETVAAAESLTAGLFCAALAEVPGASATLRGGLVVYATDLKATLAHVPADLLAAHGPVSHETAAALAVGVREACAADWGVGLTGVAGPGPVDGHGPGRVFVSVAGADGARVEQLDLTGGRAAIRAQSVECALALVLETLHAADLGASSAVGNGGASPGVTP